LLVRKLVDFPIRQFLIEVLLPILCTTLVTGILPVLLNISLEQTIHRLFVVTLVSIITTCLFWYLIGLKQSERQMVGTILINRLMKFKHVNNGNKRE
jgi:hypothetical protein